MCLVIPFDRTLIAARSSVSAEGFKALVLLQPHSDNMPNGTCSVQGDETVTRAHV